MSGWLGGVLASLIVGGAVASQSAFSDRFGCAVAGGGGTEDLPLALADFDRDGLVDIAVSAGLGVGVRWNDGAGCYGALHYWWANGGVGGQVAAGDVNGDGYPDIVCVHMPVSPSNPVGSVVYVNTGGRSFSVDHGVRLPTPNVALSSLALVDVDRDGDLDVFGCVAGQNILFQNDGQGYYSDVTGLRLTADSWTSRHARVADLDGDGWEDVIVANGRPGYVYEPNVIYWNNNGILADTPLGGAPSATVSIDVGDLNGDGFEDVVFGNWIQRSEVYWNGGGRRFVEDVSMMPASIMDPWMGPAQCVDYDGDGDVDLLSMWLRGVALSENLGGGRFGEASGLVAGMRSGWFVAADIDRDGDDDVIRTGWAGSTVTSMGLVRHVWGSRHVALGGIYGVDLHARPGHWLFLSASGSRSMVDLGALGIWQLGLQGIVHWPGVLIGGPGRASVALSVPQDPRLAGLTLHFQGVDVEVGGAGEVLLSNRFSVTVQ